MPGRSARKAHQLRGTGNCWGIAFTRFIFIARTSCCFLATPAWPSQVRTYHTYLVYTAETVGQLAVLRWEHPPSQVSEHPFAHVDTIGLANNWRQNMRKMQSIVQQRVNRATSFLVGTIATSFCQRQTTQSRRSAQVTSMPAANETLRQLCATVYRRVAGPCKKR